MPKMFSVTIGGLCQSQVERLSEILEAGLSARSWSRTNRQIKADRKLVNYILAKLHSNEPEDFND